MTATTVLHCPDHRELVEVLDSTVDPDPDNRWTGWRTHRLACGHEIVLEMEWCRDCRGLKVIEERSSGEPGHPDSDGVMDVYAVTYLECGHQLAQSTGEKDRIL